MRMIWTDGACKGNPGPGGYGVVIVEGGKVRYKHSETCEDTTNNREELKAILHAFKIACENYRFETVYIYSDSAYCVNMINHWIWDWAKNDWKNSKKKTVENLDLMKEIYGYLSRDFFNVVIKKCPGHSEVVGNELADALATGNMKNFLAMIEDYNINMTTEALD